VRGDAFEEEEVRPVRALGRLGREVERSLRPLAEERPDCVEGPCGGEL
jgi:hypothetical protein